MKGEKYLFVVSGPSGTGKDTVVAALLKKHPEIQHTVSATTRTPREGEKDGINYHFMSVADFENHLAHDQIVEHTKYCENYYGTLRSEIEGRMKRPEYVAAVTGIYRRLLDEKRPPSPTERAQLERAFSGSGSFRSKSPAQPRWTLWSKIAAFASSARSP